MSLREGFSVRRRSALQSVGAPPRGGGSLSAFEEPRNTPIYVDEDPKARRKRVVRVDAAQRKRVLSLKSQNDSGSNQTPRGLVLRRLPSRIAIRDHG